MHYAKLIRNFPRSPTTDRLTERPIDRTTAREEALIKIDERSYSVQ